MRHRAVCLMLLAVGPVAAVRADEKAKPAAAAPLPRADLEKLEGVWELKVETKSGWKGTVRATITLNPADSDRADRGRIRYEADMARGVERTSFKNAPVGGVLFGGMKRGDELLLVSPKESHLARAPLDPTAELSAPFGVADDKLTLDVSKSVARFCGPFSDIDLDWSKLVLTKAKKE